jgi:hypothetical protein
MASAAQQYGREIHDDLEYWATWLPGSFVRLGDCGSIEDFRFTRRSSLPSFGIPVGQPVPRSRGHLVHESKDGVSIQFHGGAAGSLPGAPNLPGAAAGVTIAFASENGVVFAARDCKETEISEIDDLQTALRDAYANKGFPANYVVVTGVVEASAATILISSGKKASVTLSANVELTTLADIARADAGISIASSSGLATQYVAEGELTPLFKIMGFRRHWITRRPTGLLEPQGAVGPELLEEELELGEASFDDYCRNVSEDA